MTMSRWVLANLLIILLMFQMINCRQIEVPGIKDHSTKDIKIGRMQQIKEPNFDFQSVYSRKVYQADNQTLHSFGPCRQNKPEVKFEITDEIIFDGRPPRPLVTYNFNDIKYSQFLLDIYYQNDTVYMIFQDGVAAVVFLDKNKEIKDSRVLKVEGLDAKTSLQLGYFVKISNKIIFINNAFAIEVNQTQANKIQGYVGGKLFVTAITVAQSYIAVGYEQDGVVFYKMENNQLQKTSQLKATEITTDGTLQLTDLAYYKDHNSLLVLENDEGILSFSLQLAANGLSASKGPVFIQKKSCYLMELHQYMLHVVCKDIYRISLSDWPRIQQKTLPHPTIKIRAIYADGPLVAFVGRNIFRLMYLDRLVNYFEDQSMDKLIFSKDLFLSANEGGLIIGKYNIVPPYITCQTTDPKMAGSHSLMFKTVAECNQNFFRQFNVNIGSIGNIQEDDTCIYTVYRDVYFWKTGKIMMLPIIITLIVLLVIALGVVIIWALKKLSLRRIQQQLLQYTALGATGINNNEKHQQLVEEGAETGNNRSGANNKPDDQEEESPEKKPSEIELHNQNYDIQ